MPPYKRLLQFRVFARRLIPNLIAPVFGRMHWPDRLRAAVEVAEIGAAWVGLEHSHLLESTSPQVPPRPPEQA